MQKYMEWGNEEIKEKTERNNVEECDKKGSKQKMKKAKENIAVIDKREKRK